MYSDAAMYRVVAKVPTNAVIPSIDSVRLDSFCLSIDSCFILVWQDS